MDPQLADGNGGPPTLAQPGVTKARCPKCGTTYTWTIDPIGECPDCEIDLVIVAATGETIEQAIQAAAQELPGRVEPVQPTIPGLHPKFDESGALDIIEECERVASAAERAYSAAHERAKQLRKDADEANADLRKAIRDLNKRRHDTRYESRTPDGDGVGDVDTERDVAILPGGEPQAPDTDQAGFSGLAGSTPADSQPIPDCSNAGTLALLHQAGATHITLPQVEVWTLEQVVTARAWAEEQIEAHAADAPGTQTSVFWPAHVSLAHHGPAITTHTPKPRTKPKGRRRSR